jgi:hypothetical protein
VPENSNAIVTITNIGGLYQAVQSGFLVAAVNRMEEAMAAVNAFNDRFDPSSTGLAFVEIGHVPDLARLAAADLA